MTRRNGRYGRKFGRANIDPEGSWAKGVGASAGFRTNIPTTLVGDGVNFAQAPQQERESGLKLTRHGAPKTRLSHGMTRRKK